MVHAKIVHPSSLVSEVMGKYAYLITIAMIGKRHWKTIYVSTVLIIQELKMITKSVTFLCARKHKDLMSFEYVKIVILMKGHSLILKLNHGQNADHQFANLQKG